MKHFILKYRWHPLLWLLFSAYEIISLWAVNGLMANIENYLVHYAINIVLAYIIANGILPITVGGKNRKYAALIVSVPFILIIFLMASNLADRILGHISEADFFGSSGLDEIFIAKTIWRGIYFLGLGTTIFLFENRITMLQRNTALEREASDTALRQSQLALELANARNAYLRMQINPHFMLNSLSFIYNSTRISEPGVADAVHYLSKVLRYALSSERGPEQVDINDEIEQVQNLLRIARIKKTDTYVDLNYELPVVKTKVIPFVLLSLVENMLKHGDLSNPEDPGKISISKNKKTLSIETVNLKSSGINDTGLHTGLSSVSQRLAYSYSDTAKFNYRLDQDNHFIVSVTIPIGNLKADGAFIKQNAL